MVQALSTVVLTVKVAIVANDYFFGSRKCPTREVWLLPAAFLDLGLGWAEAILLDMLHRQRLSDEGLMMSHTIPLLRSIDDQPGAQFAYLPRGSVTTRESSGSQYETASEHTSVASEASSSFQRSGSPLDEESAEAGTATRLEMSEMDQLRQLGASQNEMKAVGRLKKALASVGRPKRGTGMKAEAMLRFVRARDLDASQAAEMMMECLRWRERNNVDSIREWLNHTDKERARLKQLWRRGLHYTDRGGRPIYIDFAGSMDFRTLLSEVSADRLLWIRTLEWEELEQTVLPQCSEIAGRPLTNILCILDLSDMTMWSYNEVSQLVTKVVGFDQQYYPERLHELHIIRAPRLFKWVWAAITPTIGERTRQKVHIYSDESFRDHLLERVDSDILPTSMGGSFEGPVPAEAGPWYRV